MRAVRTTLKMKRDAQRIRALAPTYDPFRRDFDLGLAQEMEKEAQVLLTPSETLQTGLGGEIIPPTGVGRVMALDKPVDSSASVDPSREINRTVNLQNIQLNQ